MKPLLTLAICCYKFERFVGDAIDGAFAQTFRPLEIVISDDCSPDATWMRIIESVASHFPMLPLDEKANLQTLRPTDDLTLILNRNERNLGLALHENRLFELSTGEWIAFQSGDDVSKPNRMERVAEAVISNPDIRCIECRARAVDTNLNPLTIPKTFVLQERRALKSRRFKLPYIIGAGAVYHRDVYWLFGPLGAHVVNEDHVLPLRASLLGSTVRLDDTIFVLYRKYGGNQSGTFTPSVNDIARYRQGLIFMYYQEMVDLLYAEISGISDSRLIVRYRRLVRDNLFALEFLSEWHANHGARAWLIMRLLAKPRQMFLFLKKATRRLSEKFS